MTKSLFTETDGTIFRWANLEFAAWQELDLGRQEAEARVRAAALQDGSICLISIDKGTVSLDQSIANAWPYLADPTTPMGYRARNYLDHLQTAFSAFGMMGSGLIGVYLNDIYPDELDAPIFCFQKQRGSRGLLLPDVDFLSYKYYCDEGNRYIDRTPFSEKADEAIFVGSTTGDVILTAAHVRSLTNNRLRAAVYFRDHERITFHLPHVVQCDAPETEALIAELDVAGRRWSWEEQLGFRYLLSLDGNGATCSRVALGLGANSVLLKYESPYQLYYFHGLNPWKHYVPILSDGQVGALLRDSAQWENAADKIATESRHFSERFLTRHSVLRYSAEIVALYLAKFGEASEPLPSRTADHLIDVFAHVAHYGSVWGVPGAWLSEGRGQTPIEGVSLMPSEQIARDDLSCVGFGADGIAIAGKGGEFCGSSGVGKPLHGFGVALGGQSAERFTLRYKLRFADGFETEKLEGIVPVRREAPLTDMRLELRQRQLPPWRRWSIGLRNEKGG